MPSAADKTRDYTALDKSELVALLQQRQRQEQEMIRHQSKLLKQRDQLIQAQQRHIDKIEAYLNLAKVQRFGSSSEKMGCQVDLFDEAELEVALSELEAQLPDDVVERTKRKTPSRGFSDKLPRVRVEHRLSDEDKVGARSTFFVKTKEELDIVPAHARVLEHFQEKAVFEDAQGEQIKVAPRPVHPLGKCKASLALLAYIIVAKYADGLPLYRLEGILKRYGGSVTRTAMANWIIRLEDVFKPLLNLMREHQLLADYLQADETRMQVLKETGRAATSDKWMWLVRGGPPDEPVVLFVYDPSRAGEVPRRLLSGFKGVLQADGYSGYNAICRDEQIRRIGCMDHCRRKFVEASKAVPAKAQRGKVSKADVAIGKIRKLYRIEQKISALSPADKREVRQQLAKPALEELKAWLEANLGKVPKNSLTRTAMQYMLNQWEYISYYVEDGRLHISNALAENAIRPFAVGRRAWLFSDSPRGARASASCYSLIETARANGLEPGAYIKHVLEHIGTADTVEKLEALLPWNARSSLG
jgi:transposase